MDNHTARIARVLEACQTPLGFAQRGVPSWDQERLFDWRDRYPVRLTVDELDALVRIERQVFGG